MLCSIDYFDICDCAEFLIFFFGEEIVFGFSKHSYKWCKVEGEFLANSGDGWESYSTSSMHSCKKMKLFKVIDYTDVKQGW